MKTRKIILKRAALLLAGVVAFISLITLAYITFRHPIHSAIQSLYWKTDPAQTTEAARNMLDFDLPPGYQPEKVQKTSLDAVILVNQNHASDVIFIAQVPDGVLANEEWVQGYEERSAQEIGDQFYDTQFTGGQSAFIAHQLVTLRFLEGSDKDGKAVKQLVCMLKGKSGEILIVVTANNGTWDQTMVDNFLTSIQ